MMKDRLLCLIGLSASVLHAEAQDIFVSDSSHVAFYSATPIENIEAHNEASTSMLNTAANEIVFTVPMAGFVFENHLMQEHFDENYLDTKKFPYATFKGKLSDTVDVSIDTVYGLSAVGILKVHGVEHAATYTGTWKSYCGIAELTCNFEAKLSDHNIRVPRVVFANIAETIEVKVFFRYGPYEKQ